MPVRARPRLAGLGLVGLGLVGLGLAGLALGCSRRPPTAAAPTAAAPGLPVCPGTRHGVVCDVYKAVTCGPDEHARVDRCRPVCVKTGSCVEPPEPAEAHAEDQVLVDLARTTTAALDPRAAPRTPP